MEENNDIFLGDGDALAYLAGPIRNKYFTTIVSGYPFITYVSYDRFPHTFLPQEFFFFFVSDTHHFLASHSVNSNLPRKIFSLMVA